MYSIVLILHSWLRWAAILAGLAATASAAAGPGARSEKTGRWFIIAMDVQFLLGLLLYVFLSPTTSGIFGDFGAAMRDPVARFWAVEHIAMMIGAVVFAHLGSVLARKAPTPAARRTRMMICFAIATLLMIAGTPWPGFRAGRPLFRV